LAGHPSGDAVRKDGFLHHCCCNMQEFVPSRESQRRNILSQSWAPPFCSLLPAVTVHHSRPGGAASYHQRGGTRRRGEGGKPGGGTRRRGEERRGEAKSSRSCFAWS